MMRDVWPLTKLHLTELLAWNRALRAPRGKERAGRIATLVCIDFAILLLPVYLGVCMYFLLRTLNAVGLAGLYAGVVYTMVFLLTAVGALFKTSGTLYGYRDHDLLATLPVPRGALALSRVLRLYAYDAAFALLLLLPANIAWIAAARPGPLPAALAFLLMPFLPLLPMALGAGTGLLLSGVARRARGSGGNLAATLGLAVLTLGLLAAIYYGAWRLGSAAERGGEEAVLSLLMGMLAPLRTLASRNPLAGWYAAALNGGSVPAAAGLAALSVAAVGALLALYAPRMELFQKRVLSVRRRAVSLRTRGRGVLRALWAKELRRFASSPMLMLNTGLGYVMLVVAAVVLAARGGAILELLGGAMQIDLGRFIAPCVAIAFAFCEGMGNIAAASISLEGRCVWLSKTLPVPGGAILAAKALVPLSMGLSAAALGTLVVVPALSISMPGAALIFLFPTGILAFCSVFGLWLNLRSYRFDWTSETAVVKQSLPVGLAMLALMAVVLGAAGLFAAGVSLWWPTAGVWIAAAALGARMYQSADARILALRM